MTKVSKPDNYEQADEVGYLGAGSFFGHRDIIEDRRSTATVITLSKCRFLVVSKLNFFAMTQDDSAATMAEDDHAKHDVVKSLSHFHEDDLRESLKRIGKMLTKDNFVTEPSAGSRALSEYVRCCSASIHNSMRFTCSRRFPLLADACGSHQS